MPVIARRRSAVAAATVSVLAAALLATGTAGTAHADGERAPVPRAVPVPHAPAQTATASLVRSQLLSELSPPAPDSSGIAYRSDVDRLLVVDSEVNEMPLYQGVNLWELTRAGSQVVTGTTLHFSAEPTGVAYDAANHRAFISDDDKEKVFQVLAGADGLFGTLDDTVTSFSTLAFGNDDAEDVAYDTATGDLFLTQGNAQEIWRVSPGADGQFTGVAPAGDDVVSHFDVGVWGSLDVEGVAYYPLRDSLFLADRRLKQIIEVSSTGALLQTLDVTDVRMKAPAGITLAPASDGSGRTDLYVVTRGRDNDTHPDENDGMLFELTGADLGPVPPNTPPSVSAGPNRSVTMPTSAMLDGHVTDDGRPDPPGATTVAWTKLSGPGPVAFAHADKADTAATFSAAGTYVLRLSASDGAATGADTMTVQVSGSPGQSTPTCQGARALAQTGPGSDDVLRGTGGVDLLRGGGGDDVLLGRGAGDCLEGGPGHDRLRGQAGDDLLVGNGGRDVLVGGGGNDRLVAVDGKRDTVRCGAGKDRAVVDGHDRVTGCERVTRKR